MKVILEKCHVH